MEIPFIQEYARTDSVITLRVYDSYLNEFETVKIPARDGIELKAKYDYKDAPNWIYGTISHGKIIRYGYSSDPYDHTLPKRNEIFLYDIIPDQIQIITEDTIKTVFYQSYLEGNYGIDCNDNGDWSEMKDKIILSFKAEVNVNWGFQVLKDNIHIEVITDSAAIAIGQSISLILTTQKAKEKLEALTTRFLVTPISGHLKNTEII